MGLIVSSSQILTPDDLTMLETACARLRELQAVLEAIEAGQLLSALPAAGADRALHQVGVSLLSLMARDLAELIAELECAAVAPPRQAPPKLN